MTEWKDSRKEMPPADEEVLVFQGGAFSVACWQPRENGIWFNYEVWYTLAEIGRFHWMPLPDEPEGEE